MASELTIHARLNLWARQFAEFSLACPHASVFPRDICWGEDFSQVRTHTQCMDCLALFYAIGPGFHGYGN